MTNCPHPARLQAYAAGALPDDQMGEMRLHLAVCGACRALQEQFTQAEPEPAGREEVESLWRRIEPEVKAARESRRRPRSWRMLAWVTVPAVATLLLLVAPWRRPGVDAPPAAAPAVAPAPDLTLLARLEPAPVELPLEDLLVTRSTGGIGLTPELTAAFQAYQKGDYRQAAIGFGAVARKGSVRFEVHFYHGVSLLLSGQPAEAVAALEKARAVAPAAQAPRVQWYLAQAHLKLADAQAASTELDALCRAQGAYGHDACQLLEQVSRRRK